MSDGTSFPLRAPGPTLLEPSGSSEIPTTRPRRSLGHTLALGLEVITSGLVELWSHKMRSLLTLTLLMLGVFALVVMTSVLDGVVDKIGTGFSGLSWDGRLVLAPKAPETTEEMKRFAMSPGLRYEDLSRLTAPHPKVVAFMPRGFRQVGVRIAGGTERAFVSGVTPSYLLYMNRRIAFGRGLTEDDLRRRSTVAVVGGTLASKLFGGADPVGRDLMVEGIPLRIVGVLAPLQLMSDETVFDANGMLVPLDTFMDRFEPSHKLAQLSVKLGSTRDIKEVTSAMLSRVRQAHHGIEDVEVMDFEEIGMRAWKQFLEQMRGWRVVLYSLAGTVLLVGGVGVLSVMLISFSDRKYEIGLRKAMGATDQEIFVQFLLEALVLAALGALAGTFAAGFLCQALSAKFPYGLVVNPLGLVTAWAVALGLALVFGLYPAFRAMRLSPMEAMR